MRTSSLFFALGVLTSVLAHPMHYHGRREEIKVVARDGVTVQYKARATTSMDILSTGNEAFRQKISSSSNPNLLKQLADEGQAPPFIFLGCSDSRVSEGTIFDAPPGTFFGARNIANQYSRSDVNTEATISYGVSVLGAEHIIIMGHYGCGGVAAAIASAPSASIDAASSTVQAWIEPIRELFVTSSRPEIVELRNKLAGQTDIPEPEINEPGFRALVEENVKVGVARLASDSVLVNHYDLLAKSQNGTAPAVARRAEAGPPKDVFVHGFVYDIETGIIRNLGVSVGPPGKEIPPIPFEAVVQAAEGSTSSAPAASTSSASSSEPTPAATTTAAASASVTSTNVVAQATIY